MENVNELVDLTDNQENIGIGDQTLESLTEQTGNDDNIALGNKTLSLLTSGSHNIALGDSTLGLESGSENVAVVFLVIHQLIIILVVVLIHLLGLKLDTILLVHIMCS